jgi:hypothetical protein
VFIFDNIPTNTEFVGNASCVAEGISSCTIPVYNSALNRIELSAVLGEDQGALISSNPEDLNNEIVIKFGTLITATVGEIIIENQAEANWDENNNGDPNDDVNSGQQPVQTDSPLTPAIGDPTVLSIFIPAIIPTIKIWGLLLLIFSTLLISYKFRRKLT